MTRPRFTRYFTFTRTNPSKDDIKLLMDRCFEFDAALAFQTKRLSRNKVKLWGFFVLRGNRAFVSQLCRSFPNFLLSPMELSDCTYLDAGGFIYANGDLPYDDIRKQLFPDTDRFIVEAIKYKRTLKAMGAPSGWRGSIDDWFCYEKKTKAQRERCAKWQVGVHV